ncbi:MAG: lasso peptide biosynthesis B2 protein [Gemmatimonadota bacterium]
MASRADRPSFLFCLAVLATTRLSLRALGFRRTIRFAKRFAERGSTGKTAGSPAESAQAIITAAAFFPGRAVCLEQSVALYIVLRRRGHPAALRIGVQPYPFQAHAWIELDGRALFENEEVLHKYVPFPEAFA